MLLSIALTILHVIIWNLKRRCMAFVWTVKNGIFHLLKKGYWFWRCNLDFDTQIRYETHSKCSKDSNQAISYLRYMRPNSTGYPFIYTCSFHANYLLNYPRPAPIWPCSSVSRATVICSPSLTCSFATDYYLNYPRPAPIWPCSSVGRARVRSWVWILSKSNNFSLSPCGSISCLGQLLRRCY